MALLNFKYGQGTPAAYEQGTIYVSTDNKKIYVGDPSKTGEGFCAGDFIEVTVETSGEQTNVLKALKGPQQNVLYLTYNAADGYDLWKYNGTDFINLTKTSEIFGLISSLTGVVEGINTTVGNINTSLDNYVLKAEAPGYNEILTETEAANKYYEKTVIDNKFTDLKGASTKTLKELEDAAAAAQTTADTAKNTADGAVQGVATLTNKIGSIEEGTTVKAYVDQAKQGAIDAAKTAADAAYTTKEDFNTLAGSVNSLGSALGSTNSNLESNFLKKTDAANTYATKDDENTRESTLRGGYTGDLKSLSETANTAKSTADKNKEDLATTNTNVSNLGTRVTDVEGVASGAASGVSTINGRLTGIGDEAGAVKSAIDAAKQAAIDSAKTAADAAYPTKAQLETTNTNLSDLTTKVGTVETTANNAKSDITTINDRLDGIETSKGAVKSAIDAAKEAAISSAKTYADANFATIGTVNALDSKVDDLIEDIDNLSNIMNFIGVTETELKDGENATPVIANNADYAPKAGDVVIYDATEFVYDGSVWQKIGNTSAETEELNSLDGRVSGLEQRVTGLEDMTASTTTLISTVSDHETRLDQAELDIDGVQAQLTWGTFTSL